MEKQLEGQSEMHLNLGDEKCLILCGARTTRHGRTARAGLEGP